jgi:hypothetical protein
MPIVQFRKRPVVVDTILWDGTPEAAAELVAWCGWLNDNPAQSPRFLSIEGGGLAQVWNDQERCWIDVHVGHRVARGALGEFYPISPEAIDATFEPA